MTEPYIYERQPFCCKPASEMGDFLHMHNQIELIYLFHGQATACCDFSEYPMTQGDFALIFPNQLHAFKNHVPPCNPSHLLCIFDLDAVSDLRHIFTAYHVEGSPVTALSGLSPEISRIINLILSDRELQSCYVPLKNYLTIILYALLEKLNLSPSKKEPSSDWLYDVILYLSDHFCDPISADSLAKTFGINKTYLSNRFNAMIGCSIPHYLNSLRAKKATQMLRLTDHPITEIAYECGFGSTCTFFRVFRSMGLGSPSSIRKWE